MHYCAEGLFVFLQCSEHGFPQKPSALAYDPKLSLLAVGTENGDVRMCVAEIVVFLKIFSFYEADLEITMV